VYLSRQVAQVTFSSQHYDVTPACQHWVMSNAHVGVNWVIVASVLQAPTAKDMTAICDLQTSDGKVFAVVNDHGSATTGQAACAHLVAAGWVGRSAPGGRTQTGRSAHHANSAPSG
jgi:hypothetical protein